MKRYLSVILFGLVSASANAGAAQFGQSSGSGSSLVDPKKLTQKPVPFFVVSLKERGQRPAEVEDPVWMETAEAQLPAGAVHGFSSPEARRAGEGSALFLGIFRVSLSGAEQSIDLNQ